MLTILGLIGLALVFAIGAVLVIAVRKPDQFHYERSRLIAAPPDRIFEEINDLRRMNRWNPYALRETSGRADYSGPDQGPGARFDFGGNKSGTGHILLTESQAPSHVTMRLVMTKPMACDNKVELRLVPKGNATEVTWSMSGISGFMPKLFSTIIDCDKMMGKDFDEGLANLAAIVEHRPAPALAAE